ncbi:TrkH family potassium uptake protein [Pseudoflavonifractor sp. An85]|uniref:TrkH family potassium uptake protein n=1 Tax=Pseudoflavonifractor sp. An85 TaxID=1965661 RepID=UPI000B3AFAA0|nr:TrkH family potassium uptake protein [Pseudoflavonifractor sp. An85]OUN23037.1 potassium transporter KefA [Pseudoflavonifractor sp. An85]
MNFKTVFRVAGFTLLVEAAAMLLPMAVALYYGEDPSPFLKTIAIMVVLGLLSVFGLRGQRKFFAREGFFSVGLIWVLSGVFGALPFWFSGQFGSYVDCFFETISGFTTTGSSILTAIEGLPLGLLFWRSFTHWLGGMGVLILTTALLPFLGINSTHLIRAESPGPVKSKLVPRASQSSKILYAIYLGLTIIQVACLRIAGMPLYDSLIHSFGTAGTGGFSNRNLSVGAYGNPTFEIIITIFMLLFSLNFALYFLVLTGKVKQALKSDELRFFLGVTALATIIMSVNIASSFSTYADAIRAAAFQVASVISTTGFSTTDFNLWPELSRMLLVILMFIGACAGSTGGGMKCSRILVILRTIAAQVRSIIHPRSVTVVKLDGAPLSDSTIRTIYTYSATYIIIMFASALVVGLDNFSFGTTLTAVITCISNVGPGLEAVGPMGNFAAFSPLSKVVLSFCMIIGRLEIFPILVLFSRSAWKRH